MAKKTQTTNIHDTTTKHTKQTEKSSYYKNKSKRQIMTKKTHKTTTQPHEMTTKRHKQPQILKTTIKGRKITTKKHKMTKRGHETTASNMKTPVCRSYGSFSTDEGRLTMNTDFHMSLSNESINSTPNRAKYTAAQSQCVFLC